MRKWRVGEIAGVEKPILRKLKKLGIVAKKMNGQGSRSWPDRMIMIPGGRPFFIEFKRLGKVLTPLQEECHKMLRSLNYDVETHDTVQGAWSAITARLEAYGVHERGGTLAPKPRSRRPVRRPRNM